MDNVHNEILDLYEKLYAKVNDANKSNKKTQRKGKLTICPAIKGENYQQGGLMFVGRAINSWCPLDGTVVDGKIKERIARCEKCTLDWVVGEKNWSHCKNNGCLYAQDEDRLDGRKNSTPFWQMVRYICEQRGIKENWQKQIVWSNLYKASYENGDNPTHFYDEQVALCNQILIKEIEFYNPSEIYFLTETKTRKNRTWFCKEYKGKYYKETTHFGDVYKYLREKGKNIKVFVLTRPEFQIKSELYKAKQNLEGDTIVE